MALKNVLVRQDGRVSVNGRQVAVIEIDVRNEARVYLLLEGGRIEVFRFRNYRPNATARSWTRFILQRKTPVQIMNALKTVNAFEYAVRLGWKSPAEITASDQNGKPLRFTGRSN
jgi:hypothetical protein